MSPTTGWLVNKPANVSGDGLAAFLGAGVWSDTDPARHRSYLKEMSPGDAIALKGTRNRKEDLPFFSGFNAASVMSIYATGQITSVDVDSGEVTITWNPTSEARDWFFWTHPKPIWKLDPARGGRTRELYDFVFNDKRQDIDTYLDTEFWGSRFAPTPTFSWIPFYEEFATRLLTYRTKRDELCEVLVEATEDEPLLNYVSHDQYAAGTFEPMRDIDPFSVFGAFNRGITMQNRREIAANLGGRLGVTAETPTDFDGIPTVNNQNSWFMRYAYKRDAGDVDHLWNVFAKSIEFADASSADRREQLEAAYDQARVIKGIRWNLSVGMYWIRPRHFMPLDARSRSLIQTRFGLSSPNSGEEYLDLCDELQSTFELPKANIKSFPLLSYAAWCGSGEESIPHDVGGMAFWAARMVESVDLETREHEYKRKAADLIAQAQSQADADDSSWVLTLKQALNSTNTIDFRFKDSLLRAIQADSEKGRATLDTVWSSPEPASLDELQRSLQGLLGKVTPGNATALGALLLMAEDPEGNAPYSPSRTSRWYQLTGFPGGESASATSRYQRMLDFLDALGGELAQGSDSTEYSRLEVQGMAWSTTEAEPPADWEHSEQEALVHWRGDSPKDPRAWLVRSKILVPQWIEDGYVSLPASYLDKVEQGSSIAEVKAAIEAGYQHQDAAQRKALVEEYHAFLSVMKPGDVVGAIHDGRLHVGVLDGPAEYEEQEGDRLRRAVQWQSWLPMKDLSPDVASLMDRQGGVVDITEALADLQAILEGPVARVAEGPLTLPAVDAGLADELFMPRESLQEIVDLLSARKQIVLYGPPGTGKTFVAKAIARHVIGPDDPSRMQIVQFHPSYAYEDFFEGFRPYETDNGQASFTLQEGPLARIARQARADRSHPYVLVIDEMNRANLAKVFGELYFLLEYRNESMQLQYRPTEAFRLPENLFIIGTMNTADRSIALLDAAMRRRFSFVELHPDEEPVRGVLPLWLSRGKHEPERALLLDALNEAIEDQDRDLRIGPSYLMREEAATEEGLRRVWKYDVMPLLEEHYYGRMTRDQVQARFGLEALRSRVIGKSAHDVDTSDPTDFLSGDSPS